MNAEEDRGWRKLTPEEIEQVREAAHDLVVRIAETHDAGLPFAAPNLDVLVTLKRVLPDEWQRVRAELRQSGIVKVTDLDEAIKRRAGEAAKAAEATQRGGRSLNWPVDEMWSEPVNGAVLLAELANFFIRHAWLPKWGGIVLALWTVAAHVYDVFDIFPRLGISSPARRCGKTTVMTLLKQVLPRPLVVNSVTPAFVFRVIEQAQPCLLFDEGDNYLPHDLDLRAILNSGHERETAWVGRTSGDDFEPRIFSTWAPMVFAGIGDLPATLADRSIRVPMHRKTKRDKTIRFRPRRPDHAAEAAALRCRAARFAADNREALGAWDGDLHEALFNRIADNWLPLLAVADLAGGKWPEHARLAALADIEQASASEEYGELLLTDLVAIFAEYDAKYGKYYDSLTTSQLLEVLHKQEERPWPEYGRARKPLSAHQLGRLLTPFGIRSGTLRLLVGTTSKGYKRQPIEDAYTRYVDPASQSGTASQAAGEAGDSADSEASQDPDATMSQSA